MGKGSSDKALSLLRAISSRFLKISWRKDKGELQPCWRYGEHPLGEDSLFILQNNLDEKMGNYTLSTA